MDHTQPWNQPGQTMPLGKEYRSPQSNPGQQSFFPPAGQQVTGTPQKQAFASLTREELLEAKRLAEEAKFNFTGYQVVRREFVSHVYDPAMTIRENSITFNNACISKLDSATYIQFLINAALKKMAIRSCDEGARDAIRWCVVKGEKRKSREITCPVLTNKLFKLMQWKKSYRYKIQGMRITYLGQCIYLFDLCSTEHFPPAVRDPVTGKLLRSKPEFDTSWLSSFGMSVEEHTASTQIDLSSGFVSPGTANTNLPSDKTDGGQTGIIQPEANA